jgi:hypothetical protein
MVILNFNWQNKNHSNNLSTRLENIYKTYYIRYTRIAVHLIQYIMTCNVIYIYEVEHYFYMKKFKDIQ